MASAGTAGTGWSLLAAMLLLSAGCSYSFKGGSVPSHLKTIAIPIVQDQSGFGDPRLRDQFTNQLVDRFLNDNTLQLSDRQNADAVLETVITRVSDDPLVVSPGEQVTQRRLTVIARAVLDDRKMKRKLWEREFSQWGDYPSGGGPTQRDLGIQEAIRKLTEDILNETVAGW